MIVSVYKRLGLLVLFLVIYMTGLLFSVHAFSDSVGSSTTPFKGTTSPYGPPTSVLPATGSHDTAAPYGPPTFRAPTNGHPTELQKSATTNWPPAVGPSTIRQQDETTSYKTPSFGPPTEPLTMRPKGQTAPYGPPSFGPPSFGPSTMKTQGTTASYGPPFFGPPTLGPQDTTSSYGPPTFGPPTIGPYGTTAPYGPPFFGPPTLGPEDTTPSYGPPTFGPPTIGWHGTTLPYGPPSFGPPTDGSYRRPSLGPPGSDDESLNSTVKWTYNNPTVSSSTWINMPYLFKESFDLIVFIMSICPNTKSCRVGNDTDAIYQNENCCLTCDCSDNCFAKGSCCYDKEIPDYMSKNRYLLSSSKESCVYPTYGLSDAKLLRNLNKKSLLMVDHCVNNELDISESPTETCTKLNRFNISSLMDLAPYYSTQMGMSFSNKFCAVCNKASKSLTPWKRTTLSCFSLKSFSSLFAFSSDIYTFLERLETSDCILEFHAPHKTSTECIHEQSVISECDNESLNIINPKIRDYCKNETILFGKGSKIYKNIFCFGCNVFNQLINAYSCLGTSNSQGFGYDFGNPEGETALSTLEGLFVESYNNSEEIAETGCEYGFIYHQYLNHCISYACAPSKVNISGQCVPVLKTLTNVGLDYVMKYKFVIGTVESNKYTYLSEAVNMVDEDFNAQLCRQDIKATASLQDFHVTYDILVTRTVTEMTEIEEEFNIFKHRYNKTVNGREKIKTTLDHKGYETVPFGQFGFVRHKGLEDGHMCPETVAMVDLQFCDAVVVRINNDMINDNGFLRVNSMTFKQSQYLLRVKTSEDSEEMYAQICRDFFEKELEVMVQNDDEDDDNDDVNGIAIPSSSEVLMTVSLLLCLVHKV